MLSFEESSSGYRNDAAAEYQRDAAAQTKKKSAGKMPADHETMKN
jgi:hypothetical protein